MVQVRGSLSSGLLLGVIATSVLVLGGTIAAVRVPALRNGLATLLGSSPTYRVGDASELPASLYSTTPFTVLLFSRHDCAACQASKATVKALVTDFSSRGDVRVVLATLPSYDREAEIAFARDLGIAEDRIAV